MTRESIRQRVAAATEGPWEDSWSGEIRVGPSSFGEMDMPADAEFVAHARQDVPALLAVADAAADACVSGKPESIRRLGKALAALEALP